LGESATKSDSKNCSNEVGPDNATTRQTEMDALLKVKPTTTNGKGLLRLVQQRQKFIRVGTYARYLLDGNIVLGVLNC
jgi:hypothetical protein